MLELLRKALRAGHSAKYVLFDSWFAAPKGITAIKQELGLDVIAMLKSPARYSMRTMVSSLMSKNLFHEQKAARPFQIPAFCRSKPSPEEKRQRCLQCSGSYRLCAKYSKPQGLGCYYLDRYGDFRRRDYPALWCKMEHRSLLQNL